MYKNFKFYRDTVKTNPFIALLLVAGISFFLITDVYAFSVPVVKTTKSITDHIVLIGIAAGALAIAHFLYTFYIGEPAWKRAVYTLIGITGFTGFASLVDWAMRGMN